MKERYTPAVRDKAYQMLNVAYMLRPVEHIAETMTETQTLELTRKIKGKEITIELTSTEIAGIKKILFALMNDLIDMGVPEVAYPALNYYKNGNEEKLTKKEEKTVKRLLG